MLSVMSESVPSERVHSFKLVSMNETSQGPSVSHLLRPDVDAIEWTNIVDVV
jgi:hypothetical protein